MCIENTDYFRMDPSANEKCLNDKEYPIGLSALLGVFSFCSFIAQLTTMDGQCDTETFVSAGVYTAIFSCPCLLAGGLLGHAGNKNYCFLAAVGVVSIVANAALIGYNLTHCSN